MPELPEVETIVRHLRPKITGRKILDMSSNTPRIFRDHKSFSEVKKQVIGKKIESVERLGKNILFNLSGGVCLAIHLMMTGKLLVDPVEKSRHDRFLIKFAGGTNLVFNDIRKFGRCRIFRGRGGRTSTIKRSDLVELNVGHDALAIKFKEFKSLISSKKKIIKNFLLDQRAISGIGNIYADEILWAAGIHPLRKTDSLSGKDLKNLFSAIKKVLTLAIKKGGTSSRDYRKPDGSEGGYYQIRKAYQRTGEGCARDGTKIQRIVAGGRATHFCPKHQK